MPGDRPKPETLHSLLQDQQPRRRNASCNSAHNPIGHRDIGLPVIELTLDDHLAIQHTTPELLPIWSSVLAVSLVALFVALAMNYDSWHSGDVIRFALLVTATVALCALATTILIKPARAAPCAHGSDHHRRGSPGRLGLFDAAPQAAIHWGGQGPTLPNHRTRSMRLVNSISRTRSASKSLQMNGSYGCKGICALYVAFSLRADHWKMKRLCAVG